MESSEDERSEQDLEMNIEEKNGVENASYVDA